MLRYFILKSIRDGSLVTCLVAALALPLAALIGSTMWQGLRFPLYFEPNQSASGNAATGATVSLVMAMFFATLFSFWTFRTEIATKSAGTFVFGTRPLAIIIALTLFGGAIGILTWVPVVALLSALTASLPPDLASLLLQLFVGSFVLSGIGALVLVISPQPFAMIAAYMASLVAMVALHGSKAIAQVAVAAILLACCTALSAFLLERRCAS